MIFVTVGTWKFDALIEQVALLIKEGRIKEDVLFQIGKGNYIPKNGKYFRYKPSIEQELDTADLVICHGGTGTVLFLLKADKPFIAVPNPNVADNHQYEFLKKLSDLNIINCCFNLNELGILINQVKKQPKSKNILILHLAEEIAKFLNSL